MLSQYSSPSPSACLPEESHRWSSNLQRFSLLFATVLLLLGTAFCCILSGRICNFWAYFDTYVTVVGIFSLSSGLWYSFQRRLNFLPCYIIEIYDIFFLYLIIRLRFKIYTVHLKLLSQVLIVINNVFAWLYYCGLHRLLFARETRVICETDNWQTDKTDSGLVKGAVILPIGGLQLRLSGYGFRLSWVRVLYSQGLPSSLIGAKWGICSRDCKGQKFALILVRNCPLGTILFLWIAGKSQVRWAATCSFVSTWGGVTGEIGR